jgi:beta-galactosidase
VPVNADKKRIIVAALLRNLNATFAAGPQELAPGEALRYTPVPLDDKCNRFLAGADAWFKNTQPRDMAALPRGKGRFAGVDYTVREFITSPLPSVIVLNGSGAAGLEALPMQVAGIPVNKKVDALFFLHAYNQYAQPEERRDRNPVVFQYVIHYEDGQTLAVPARLGLEVAHWVSKDPSGLRNAALAWTAPFPNDASGEQAALYQMQWNNPRPDVAVQSVDVAYGDAGNRLGQAAVVAITAANAVK